MKLILASNSPRRKELLLKAGVEFTVISSSFSETDKKDGIETAVENAFGKAFSVYEQNKDAVVLGADTVVILNGKILGKPKDEQDAFNTLKTLSGKTHYVVTGYAIISENFIEKGYEKTAVTFNKLSDKLITEYVNTGLPLDKAGSYGIQDGFNLVKNYDGSFTNIVGLPVEKILPLLKKAGVN